MKIIKNKILERLRNKTKNMNEIQKFNYLYKNYADFYSMIEDIERFFRLNIKESLEEIIFFYEDPYDLSSGEHSYLHRNFDDIEEYIKNIPPIIRIYLESGDILGNDGNHRINTCRFYNVKVPTIAVFIDKYR
ncbi:MAG: hypothetical protein ACTSRP_07340 [Candidatus Helarchaeota archaeon]